MNLTNYIWRFKNVSEIEFKTLFLSSFCESYVTMKNLKGN